MDARTALRMATVVAALVCLVLLFTSTSRTGRLAGGGDFSRNCGSVVDRAESSSCDRTINNRLTISLIVGAVGVATYFGSTQVKNREDD